MRLHGRLLFLIVSGALLIPGCATTPSAIAPQNQNVAWDSREKNLTTIENWNLQGQLAIRTKTAAESATINWKQNKQNYALNLMGPMGSNSYLLTGSPGKVTLENPKGEKFSAATPEELLVQQTGWRLPVSYLQYWIRGIPVPSIPAQKRFDQYNHLTELTQEGWRVQYLRYTSTNGIDLPSKIFINSPDLSVKIIVSQWQV